MSTRRRVGFQSNCRFPSARNFACLAILFLALLLLLPLGGVGCRKKPSSASGSNGPKTPMVTPLPLDKDVIASFHWLGKKRISLLQDAIGPASIWNLPESSQLEAHILDKTALAPWRLTGNTNIALNDPAPQLSRSLLDDLLQEEWYLEVRRATNQSAALGLAIRLSADRATAWTNAWPAIVESLRQQSSNAPALLDHLDISSVPNWILVGIGQQQNPAIAAMKARLEREGRPFVAAQTNFWVEAHIDLAQFELKLPLPNLSGASTIDLTLNGDGKDVLTRALFTFADPINLNLEHWNLPVQMIPTEPMGLTAINGIRPLLARSKIFAGLPEDSVPNQIFFWDRRGLPLQMFFAFPTKTAQQTFETLAPRFAEFLQSHPPPGMGSASINTTNSTFIWENFVFGSPFLHAVTNDGVPYVLGGFALPTVTRSNRMPAEIAAHIVNATNLLFYDLENTGQRLSHWRYLDDTWRILSDVSHSPRIAPTSPSLVWIANCSSNLLFCTSELRLESPKTLTFARKSTIGLTSLEIDLLANWIEMPSFPLGFNTLWQTSSVPSAVVQRKSTPPNK